MKTTLCAILLCLPWPAQGASTDELRSCASRSNTIVVGTFRSEPVAALDELGVAAWAASFEVEQVVKGDRRLKGRSVRVSVTRFELPGHPHPLLKKGRRCVLLVDRARSDPGLFVGTDGRQDLQRPSAAMVHKLEAWAARGK